MKENKKMVYLGLLILIGLFVLVFWSLMNKNNNGGDFRIGVIADDGLALISFSKERQMINVLKLESDSQVWIPKGMGWYRSEVIKQILQQEKQEKLINEVFFYNFGFVINKGLILNRVDDWKSKFWWRMKFANNYFNKEEYLIGDVDKNDDFLDKVMVRDFSETNLISEDLKISVVNLSKSDGLANFMTKRLERMGFSVVSVMSSDDVIEKCTILYGDEVEPTYSWKEISRLFDCEKKKDPSLNENEIEFYFDDNFSTVIKYPSYKK